MATVDELLIQIDATTESLRREMKRAQDAVAGAATGMQRDVGRMDKALAGIERSLSGVTRLLGAFGIALGVRALAGFTRGALDAAGGLGELAQQLGVSTQSLQVYQYAATQAGLKSEELNTGLARLSRTIGEAATGEKEASQAFARLGVAVTDASGQVRSTDAVLRDVADRFKAMPDDAREAAAAVDLFGKAGQKLLPILNEGSAGLDRFAERARALGIVLSEDQIAAADKAADQWAEFEMVMGRIAQSVAVELAPALSNLFTTLNQPEVIQGIATLFGALAEAIRIAVQGFAGFVEVVSGATPLLDNVARLTGAGAPFAALGESLAAMGAAAMAAAPPVASIVTTLGSGELSKAEQAFRGVAEAIQEATLDLEFEATLVGKTARQVDYLTQRRKLLNAAAETGHAIEASTLELIDGMAERYAAAAEEVRGLEAAQKASQDAAEEAAKAAEQAAQEVQDEVRRISEDIAGDLTTALFEGAESGFDDIFANLGKWLQRIGLEILKQQFILPITTELVGGLPGLFGIGGGAGGNGSSIVGAVGSLASDGADWLGRIFGFGPSAQSFANQYGTVGAARSFAPGLFDSVAGQMGFGGFDLGGLLGGAATGYGLGGLVGGLMGSRGPGSGIGGALGGALGTLTTSFLGPLGPLLGGALGGLVGSMFGPGPSAGPFSYGTAHSQGGRLAYVGSKSLKGGVGDMAPLVNETTAVANQIAELFGAEFADNALLRIGYIANEQGTKGYAVSGAGKGNQAFNNYKFFGENKQAAQLFAIEQAIAGGGFNGLSVGGGLQGMSAEEKQYLGKSFDIRKTTEEVLADVRLIVDLFGETDAVLSDAAIALRDLNQSYDEQVERARELGIAEAELERRRAEAIGQLKNGFVEGINDQILAITDPTAFALKMLDKEFESIRANAEDFGVGLAEVEQLYGLKRQQILEQIGAATVSSLLGFYEQLRFGGLSGAAPADVLAGSRAAFEATAAQALAGDGAARGRIEELGATFLTASRAYNASGGGYYSDLERVTEVVRQLLGEVPGYAAGTWSAAGGLSWVGEAGPELVALPPRAAVLPNAISAMMAGAANDGAGGAFGGAGGGAAGGGLLRQLLLVASQGLQVNQRMAARLDAMEQRQAQMDSALRRLLSKAVA